MKNQKQRMDRVCVILLLCLAVLTSFGILVHLIFLKENPQTPKGSASGSLYLMDRFDEYIAKQVASSQGETIPVERTYRLSDDELVSPEPDESCYGFVHTSDEIKLLMDRAEELLNGQSCYFSADTERMDGKPAQYYLDDTIFAVTWKEVHGNCVYTFSEVKIAHPSQFRRFLAGGEYGSNMQFYTSEMAANVNAVVASSGDFYGYRHIGTNIYNGKVYTVDKWGLHTCLIDENGDLSFVYKKDMPDIESAQKYVTENGIRFGLSFGPVLIENGEIRKIEDYQLGEVNERYSRAALCQMDQCHYLLCTANYEEDYYATPTMNTFARVLATTGCRQAYAIDGGQTATIVMQDEVINSVSYGSQRKISDIIYFATAIP